MEQNYGIILTCDTECIAVAWLNTLACSIVCSRFDYYNSVLYGAPSKSISKLQRIQNNLARIVLEVPRRTHAPPLLHQLHWLPVEQSCVQTSSHYIQGPCTVDSKLLAQSTDSPQLHEDVALIRSAVIVHSSCSDSNHWTCFSRCSSIDLEHSTTSCLFL